MQVQHHGRHQYRDTDGPTAAKLIKQLSQFDGSFREFLWDPLALRQRKSVMRTDHWLEEQLSFAGKE